MPGIKRVCVFCGSSSGVRPAYQEATLGFGHLLAGRGIGLVYGGSHRGLMGTLADAVLERGGQVIGVIPRSMVEREIAHTRLPDLRVVETMHERKALMASLADAFVAMPGGFGTSDELCEVVTWTQIGLHAKPCGLLNVEGFFDPFLRFVDHAVAEGFVRPNHRAILTAETDASRLLDEMERFRAPMGNKWMGA